MKPFYAVPLALTGAWTHFIDWVDLPELPSAGDVITTRDGRLFEVIRRMFRHEDGCVVAIGKWAR